MNLVVKYGTTAIGLEARSSSETTDDVAVNSTPGARDGKTCVQGSNFEAYWDKASETPEQGPLPRSRRTVPESNQTEVDRPRDSGPIAAIERCFKDTKVETVERPGPEYCKGNGRRSIDIDSEAVLEPAKDDHW